MEVGGEDAGGLEGHFSSFLFCFRCVVSRESSGFTRQMANWLMKRLRVVASLISGLVASRVVVRSHVVLSPRARQRVCT